MPASGLALRLKVSPQAAPMRRRPKSKASTNCGDRPTAVG
jgi:hypothetical protein